MVVLFAPLASSLRPLRLIFNNMEKKQMYVPPTVEVRMIVVDAIIAASPVRQIDLKDWQKDDNLNDPDNNSDIWLNL